MDRRRFVGTLVGLTSGLAGCAEADADGAPDGTTASATDSASPSRAAATTTPPADAPLARRGRPSDICALDPDGGATIPAITGAGVGADWSDVETGRYGPLTDKTVVVGVARDGMARAYPLEVLYWHEVVNDDLAGPLLVTYCSRCDSALVAQRVVRDDPTPFGVTGHLWLPPDAEPTAADDDGAVFGAARGGDGAARQVSRDWGLVMYDAATGSYWSQLIATAICGPERGTRLRLLPAEATTWGAWRRRHPDTTVLLPPPGSLAVNPPYPGDAPPGL